MSNATHIHEVGGKPYRQDTRGALVPESAIKPMDLLQDEQVRKMVGFARDLSGQIARFKGHTYDDIGSLQALIAQEYGAKIGGQKGNITLTSFDGLLKVQVQVQDQIDFGAELQAAKELVDECLREWAAELARRNPRAGDPRLSGRHDGQDQPRRNLHAAARGDHSIRAGTARWTRCATPSA